MVFTQNAKEMGKFMLKTETSKGMGETEETKEIEKFVEFMKKKGNYNDF